MRDFEYGLDRLSRLTGIEITCYAGEQFWDIYQRMSYNPLRKNRELLTELIRKSDSMEEPVIMEDIHHVIFSCIKRKEVREEDGMEYYAYFLLGPVSIRRLDLFELHRYYWDYGMRKGVEKSLPVVSYLTLLSFVESAALILLQKQYSDSELVQANRLYGLPDMEEIPAPEQALSISEEDENDFHHTYEEERRLLGCVREGKTEDALEQNMKMDQMIGKMSHSSYIQTQKIVVVAITLCTRAAIEGGLSPAEAYRLSDHYIRMGEKCRDIPSLINCRNQAVRDLTERVNRHLQRRQTSSYVAAACDYIARNYREKIYLEEIADVLGISPSYLSRLFAAEMDVRLQDYIVQVRVERAANLLAYSDESIAAIGDYVNFPSQSYFGKVFKKYKQMTPKEYRDRHKPKEFRRK